MNILLLMSGSSEIFQEAGYSYPKNLVEIDGLPLLQRVMDNLSSLSQFDSQFIYMIRQEENRQYHTGSVIRLLAPDGIIGSKRKYCWGCLYCITGDRTYQQRSAPSNYERRSDYRN